MLFRCVGYPGLSVVGELGSDSAKKKMSSVASVLALAFCHLLISSDISFLLRMGNRIPMEGVTETKVLSRA